MVESQKGPVSLHLEEDEDSLTASVQRDGADTSRMSPIHPTDMNSFNEDASSIIDYNQIFQKQEYQSTKNLLKEMSRKRFSMREIEQEEKKQQLSYQEQLKQQYSTDYGGFKTPMIAFFYFFQFTTKQSKQIIDLFEGCDNKKNFEVELKEFGLRYCSSQKMMFFILYYFYNLVFQGQFIHPNDGKLVKEDGSREDAPNRNSFKRQQSMKVKASNIDPSDENIRHSLTQNNPYLPADGLSTPYVNMLCFLTHFLSLRPNDYVIYFHWLLSYGNKTPLSRRDLTNVILILQKDQQIHRENAKTTTSRVTSLLQPIQRAIASLRPANAGQILSQYSFSSKKKSSSSQPSNSKAATSRSVKATNTYLDTIKDENISSGLLRVIDTKMRGIISISMLKLRRFLMQQMYSEKAFWSDIIRKMRVILYEQNTLDYYHTTVKQMHPEDVDLCYDFRIMKVRKTSERVLRRCIRYWQHYQQMVQLEAQSLSDLSGIDKSSSVYQRYCLPFFIKIAGSVGAVTSSGSAKIHPEFHIENIRQLSILQGAEVSGSLIGGGFGKSQGKGRLSINEAIRKFSVMLIPRKNSKDGRYSQGERDRQQQQKISFKSLTAKPTVPSNKELQQTTMKVKRKAFQAIDEVERLLEEAKEPSRKTNVTVSGKSVESRRRGEGEEGSDDGYSDSDSNSDSDGGSERHDDGEENKEKEKSEGEGEGEVEEEEREEGKDDVVYEEEGGNLAVANQNEAIEDHVYHPDLAV